MLSCSARKRSASGPVAALDLYDGVHFKVLRKAIREDACRPNVDVLILSARYGLIDASSLIESYDQRMTASRSEEMRPQVSRELAEHVGCRDYLEIFLNLGKTYLQAVTGWDSQLAGDVRVVQASGSIGQRAAQLRCWLRGEGDGTC